MYGLRSFVTRFLNIFRRSRLEADLSEQLDAHREMIKADLISRGKDPAEADAAARRALGNDQLVREFSRDEMVHRWIDVAVRDVRYALRSLLRTPAFTVAVVLTLALGIGANTAIFSIVDRLLLRPLPFPHGEQLVVMHENGLKAPGGMDVNRANWVDWQRDSKSFESLAAWTDRFPLTLTGQGEPERLKTEMVSHEFFSVLAVKPLLGRVFNLEDDRPQAPGLRGLQSLPHTAILSYSLWQRKFSGDPHIIGRIVELDGTHVEVIGVMSAGFHFLSRDTDVWMPFTLDRNFPWRDIGGRFIPYVVGRLKPGVTHAVAQREMESIAGRLAQTYTFNKNTSVTVIPLREVMTGEVRTSLLMLFAAVGVLLLIACSNVANLLIARSSHRRREIAIRTSLGAGRGAIVRQLLTESLLLASSGGIVGIFFARWGVRVLATLAPANLLQVSEITIDPSMLLYTVALSLLTGVLVGIAPAMPSVRLDVADYLRNGGRSVTMTTSLRQALIIAQVAMTVMLLCGAGLLVRSLLALTRDPIGVNPSNVLTLRVELPSRYNPAQQVAFFQEVTERLRALPGVESASAASDIPVSTQRMSGTGFSVLGQPEVPLTERPSTRVRVVTPGYFKTLGIPLLKGRDFTQDDQIEGAPQVFVVNETFAAKYFPAEDPLSVSISVFMRVPDNPYGRIIGVVGNVKEGNLRGLPEPTVFYNHRQLTYPGMTLFVRSRRGSELAQEAVQTVREIDRNLPVVEVRMLEDAFAESVARERLNALVSAAFAVCALLLASVGLYGLLAFTVAERTNEIGIRMALGAQASEILRMVMKQGLRLVVAGTSLGLAAAFAASRVLETLLFGVSPNDPATFASVAMLLVLVSLTAILIPAHRATQVNPIAALRED